MDYLKYFKNDTLFEGTDNFFKKYKNHIFMVNMVVVSLHTGF